MTAPSDREVEDQLVARHVSEERFHDSKYVGEVQCPRHYKANPTYAVYLKMKEMLGDIRDKRVLEYGCGDGWITHDLAAAGALIDAFDISAEAVNLTMDVLRKSGLEKRCTIGKMAGESLEYPSDTFDIAVGFAILHHLDIKKALPELRRVLKPGGVAFFAEPLGTNPLINLYRKFTPQFRTADERPIVLKEITQELEGFQSFRHNGEYVLALGSIALLYVPLLNRAYPWVNKCLRKADDWLLSVFPSLERWAWYSILVFQKSDGHPAA